MNFKATCRKELSSVLVLKLFFESCVKPLREVKVKIAPRIHVEFCPLLCGREGVPNNF